MPREFKLPDLGEGVHEGEVLAVHVSPGQSVNEGDIIFEVETDKAAVEIPSPYTGVVSEVLVAVGDTVNVGSVMLRFENGGDRPAQQGSATEVGSPEVRRREAAPKAPPADKHERPVPASPATRRLARELGIDLRTIKPTGNGGVVTADDVRDADNDRKAVASKTAAASDQGPARAPGREPTAAQLPDFSQWGPVERIPFRSIRRATANQMVTAWSTVPHVSSQDSVDVTRLDAFRLKHASTIVDAGGRLTLTVFVLKAVATALKTYPEFNASLDMASQEIIHKHYYHIGVAVNTPDGLIVPVIRDVDRKSIKELAIELQECVRRTRDRKISREALQGGTFTITNAGAMGGGFFTPIVNFPEVAILGMGQARMKPVVDTEDGNRIVARLMMPVVLCFDHRIADGAGAIGFLRVLIDALEDPDELLMTMI
jgi:pyruvate dehydrogenase E2 component (dihydrolipoamide acetyltransferase)